MNLISNSLYWISTGLLVPVIVLLIILFARSLVMIGAFFGQYVGEKKTSAAVGGKIRCLTPETVAAFGASLPEKPATVMEAYVKKIIDARGNEAMTELLLSEYELEADRSMSTSKVLAKTGPILGLMGTLIPMGPALAGLASGNIASMAYNMQVAFATTVVGLVVSAIGFLTLQVRERWAVANLTVLEYLADVVGQSASASK